MHDILDALEDPATDRRVRFLADLGMDHAEAAQLTKDEADQQIRALKDKPTTAQLAMLRQLKVEEEDVAQLTTLETPKDFAGWAIRVLLRGSKRRRLEAREKKKR